MTTLRTLLLTALAMFAFAANSVLCRLALHKASIDPASFASVRLVSGALVLALLLRRKSGAAAHSPAPSPSPVSARPDWIAATMLWVYVVCFSFAYLSLAAGTGALILFGAVQLTMFSVGMASGERFAPMAWAGLALSVAGFVHLVSPGIEAPAPWGAALMALAGIAWGVYSLRGRKVGDPLAATANNFLRASPLALAMSVVLASSMQASASGIALAIASGAITSGLGYVVWYAALRGLTSLRAAAVQLSVPPIAAIGGALLLAETITTRLWLDSLAILGGITLVLMARAHRP